MALYNRSIADRNDEIERQPKVAFERLALLAREIDPDLLHDTDCLRAYLRCDGSGAEHVELVGGVRAQQTFGHL